MLALKRSMLVQPLAARAASGFGPTSAARTAMVAVNGASRGWTWGSLVARSPAGGHGRVGIRNDVHARRLRD